MPIVATSEPLIFGGDSPSPSPTITPTPYTDWPTDVPPISPELSDFVAKHQYFIQQVDNLNSCFKREEIVNLTDQEFDDHVTVAQIDKYLVQEEDLFCSKQGVKILSDKLKRFID